MDFLKEINIKSDMPAVSDAEKRLDAALKAGKKLKAGAVKVIHGYGSGGKGGKIRTMVRKEAAKRLEEGTVHSVIFGENFSVFDENTRKAFTKCPELRDDKDLDRYNNGVTIFIL